VTSARSAKIVKSAFGVTRVHHVILATGSVATQLLLQETHTVPVIFTIVPDPVGSGFVESLAQPGGNASGFMPT
jgi:ABC-type uncharacterized transport system substrate-binding protein